MQAPAGLGKDGTAFLERMRLESGIMAYSGDGSGKLGFLHLSFQEFLAADHAVRKDLASELAPRAANSWWREAALLSLRRSETFCGRFFRTFLEQGFAEKDLDLAHRCLNESLYFTPEPFLDVLRAPNTPAARKIAVLKLLGGRADQVPGLAEICESWISDRTAEPPNLHGLSLFLKQLRDRAMRLPGFARFGRRRLPHTAAEIAEIRGMAIEILTALGRRPIATAATRTAGDLMVHQDTGMPLIWVPPGKFRMGSDKGYANEKPVHAVEITRGFYLGKYPVTNEQYAKFLATRPKGVHAPLWWNDRKFNQPQQPVVGINWDDAVAFCRWMGGRLPTEAEWEYACRAGSQYEYCFGDNERLLNEYAWTNCNSSGQPQPVGGRKPNSWGLHDMHGNVWEWCKDPYAGDYYELSPAQDPPGPLSGSFRVLRGGSWSDEPLGVRRALRLISTPDDRDFNFGFRLVLE